MDRLSAAVQRGLHARGARTPPAAGSGCSARRRRRHTAPRPCPCRSRAGRRSGAGCVGSSVNRTISCMNRLPPSSAGCALPATTICTGRSGSSRIAPQPGRVAQHQGQPLVGGHPAGEADGQDVRVQDRLGPAELGDRSLRAAAADRRAVALAIATSRCRSVLPQLPEPLRRTPCPRPAIPRPRPDPASRPCRRPRRTSPAPPRSAGAPRWSPTRSAPRPARSPGTAGRTSFRDTAPCSLATPLARCASRRPMWAMLNRLGSSSDAQREHLARPPSPGSSRDDAVAGPGSR